MNYKKILYAALALALLCGVLVALLTQNIGAGLVASFCLVLVAWVVVVVTDSRSSGMRKLMHEIEKEMQ